MKKHILRWGFFAFVLVYMIVNESQRIESSQKIEQLIIEQTITSAYLGKISVYVANLKKFTHDHKHIYHDGKAF